MSDRRAWTCGLGNFRELNAHAHNPFLLQRRKSRYAELDFEVSAGASLWTDRLGTRAFSASGSWGRTQGQSPGTNSRWDKGVAVDVHPGSGLLAPNPQKIMHTRKRHQDMFQDLNRKLQHAAEKEKEVPGVDSKVRRVGSAPTTTNLTSFIPSLPGFLIGLSLCWLSALRCAQGRAGGS